MCSLCLSHKLKHINTATVRKTVGFRKKNFKEKKKKKKYMYAYNYTEHGVTKGHA